MSAYFEYDGIKSSDMYLRIENNISFPSPEADLEFLEVLGKDGDLVIDRKRLKGVTFPIPVQLRLPENVTVNEQATEISNWLKSDPGWKPLVFSGQEDYHYIAICYEQFDFAETLRNFGRTVINFRLKPYKMHRDNHLMEITNGTTLVNNGRRTAKPYIKVTGEGDITLQKNGEDWAILTAVDGFLEIDSELMSVYKGPGRHQNKKFNSQLPEMFPLLPSGESTITWTGNVTKLEIEPRWGAIT